jgi:TPP-dependent indolepyruvate ferredoxin oxidoreductase alpha subunit
VYVLDHTADPERFEALVGESMEKSELTVIVARRTCLLATRLINKWEKCELQ